MKTVRLTAAILYYLSRILAIVVFASVVYAGGVLLLHYFAPTLSLPLDVENGGFKVYLPFTQTPFLLGDYTASFLVSNLLVLGFYGAFLWLLSGVFYSFRQAKLFTQLSVRRLVLFYGINLGAPVIFLALLAAFGTELIDLLRIILLHLVIGVFSFFMAAIFRQGLVLQEEQDLTF